MTGDAVPQSCVQATRRLPPPPAPTSFLLQTAAQTRPLLRTPTVGDGPPVPGAERKTQPGQAAKDSIDISTLPRAKSHTTRATKGEVCQGQMVLPVAANQAIAASRPVQTSSNLPVNGLSNLFNSHNPAVPTSKSKNVSFIRDRVQFFTRNELAAAVAMNKKSSSSNSQTTAPSKTNWFRRALFK